jgi:hypothetical protein
MVSLASYLPLTTTRESTTPPPSLIDDLMGVYQEDIDEGQQLVGNTSGKGLPKDDAGGMLMCFETS